MMISRLRIGETKAETNLLDARFRGHGKNSDAFVGFALDILYEGMQRFFLPVIFSFPFSFLFWMQPYGWSLLVV